MKLYNFSRSGTSIRARIALELKGLPYNYVSVDLPAGEHRKGAYLDISPDTLVPLLEVDEHTRISQSLALIEFLDETHPEPPLLPADPWGRAQVRALALTAACEIHPINNMRVLNYHSHELAVDEAARADWYNHWILEGLHHYENRLRHLQRDRQARGLPPSLYSFGSTPTLADCALVPQVINGRRFGLDYSRQDFPLTLAAFEACMQLPAVQRALPEAFPSDAG
jgi:maleylacetoacetate isomerase/maleylpyruvate isomerase